MEMAIFSTTTNLAKNKNVKRYDVKVQHSVTNVLKKYENFEKERKEA
jgi:hypothetical protein